MSDTNNDEYELGADFPEGFWEDLPQPSYWRILIAPVKARAVSKGGILLAQSNQEAQNILNFMGQIVALGLQAGIHEKLGGDGVSRGPLFPKVKDYVIYGRYAGQVLQYKGVTLRVLNDDEILGTVSKPESLTTSI